METFQLVGGLLFGTAARLLRRPEEAEEVVQETLVRLFQNALHIKIGSLHSWLHRVTVNQCLDRLEAKGRNTVVRRGVDAAGGAAGIEHAGNL